MFSIIFHIIFLASITDDGSITKWDDITANGRIAHCDRPHRNIIYFNFSSSVA